MATHYSGQRQPQIAPSATRLGRDVTWGRLLFLPPELANPRIIFDPLPFRTHDFGPERPKKSPYTR